LLFNANSVIFQLYHGEYKLIFDRICIHPPKKRLGYIGLLLSVRSFVRPVVTLFRLSESLCPWVLPSLPMQFLLNNLMELHESYRKSLIPYGKVH
jgi:hypothetical protein